MDKKVLKEKERKRMKESYGMIWGNEEFEIYAGTYAWLASKREERMLAMIYSGYGKVEHMRDPDGLMDPMLLEWSLYADGWNEGEPVINVVNMEGPLLWENKKYQIVRDERGFNIFYREKSSGFPWIGKVFESEHAKALIQHWINLFEVDPEQRLVPLHESKANSRWSLPPYKSEPFFKYLAERRMTLDEFKIRPIYAYAVEQGKIAGDEWAG
ncbi:hypothetical protein ACFO25_00475 [Paenactinomyces guangxiensis]|uniref:Uncharacterized protein n=1 Tax=Paenactinomyces guangxiensis TaxID=1490290 RepID=A0A7W1WSU8_9BACL|nr:hypothetical protein [Paenactinomyces guangxiensis]MBA4495206.1 hypothetical protein [Paenactinomyces guangxiensis]MBH8592290.1 hypothetical protein [Paenactinomyces guangxiensis]